MWFVVAVLTLWYTLPSLLPVRFIFGRHAEASAMSDTWYFARDKNRLGPFSTAQMWRLPLLAFVHSWWFSKFERSVRTKARQGR
jgi:hypothetical protein